MSDIIEWCSFVGAWLLVIGPIQQAAIDINDEDFDRDEFGRALANVPRPPRISRWWLLVPPVAYILRARRNHDFQETMLREMSASQLEDVLHFRETTSAWMFVAVGGFLLAVSETWALHAHYRWSVWTFWVLMIGMVAFSIVSTVGRVHRRTQLLERARQ